MKKNIGKMHGYVNVFQPPGIPFREQTKRLVPEIIFTKDRLLDYSKRSFTTAMMKGAKSDGEAANPGEYL
jgi:hypothetical protein